MRRRPLTPRRRAAFAAVAVVGAALALAGEWATRDWYLGLPSQAQSCLPYRVFLVSRRDRAVGRGDYVGFLADGRVQPFFAPGQLMVKQVVGVEGDRVTVSGGEVLVNGVPRGTLVLAATLGQPPARFGRDERVPPGAYWVMGTAPNSFDSRYWGYLGREQVVGRAYPLW